MSARARSSASSSAGESGEPTDDLTDRLDSRPQDFEARMLFSRGRSRAARPARSSSTGSPASRRGDGKSDLLFRGDGGTLLTDLMNGPQVLAAQVVDAIGPEWSLNGVGDFNAATGVTSCFGGRTGP
jgi:hypothetical protein